jgi:hypothetical protein
MYNEVTYEELEPAFGFLFMKVLNLGLKTKDGREICPLYEFCEENEDNCTDNCIIERIKKSVRLRGVN